MRICSYVIVLATQTLTRPLCLTVQCMNGSMDGNRYGKQAKKVTKQCLKGKEDILCDHLILFGYKGLILVLHEQPSNCTVQYYIKAPL